MDDERLLKVEQEKQKALTESNNVYTGLLQDNQNIYNQQMDYANQYEQTQNEVLDKQLAYNQQLIEQQKEIARENKETEAKKALNDYTAFINPYGYQAENLASRGLLNSGVSETSQLGGFNTYQNRLATANKAMQDAFVQYDNDINQARLNNDVQKAQNALNKLQLQLEYAQNFYNNKSTLSQNQLANNQDLDNNYFNRYQTEYSNIQEEKARAEQIRQWEKEYAEQVRQYNEDLAYRKAQLAEQIRQYNSNLAYQQQLAAQEQANWEREYAASLASAKSSGSSKSSKSSGSSNSISTNYGTSKNGVQLVANPNTGTLNSDAKNGVFSNGYQPDNINGKKLKKSGSTTTVNGKTQNIWIYDNGKSSTLVVWDGNQNQYVVYRGTLG